MMTDKQSKRLKENLAQLDFMASNDKETIKALPISDLRILHDNGTFVTLITSGLYGKFIYRLRFDYKPKEDGLVYCEITESAGDLCYMHPVLGNTFIDTAVRQPDFVGGLYEIDGKKEIYRGVTPRLFDLNMNEVSCVPVEFANDCISISPTHIVLRRAE